MLVLIPGNLYYFAFKTSNTTFEPLNLYSFPENVKSLKIQLELHDPVMYIGTEPDTNYHKILYKNKLFFIFNDWLQVSNIPIK